MNKSKIFLLAAVTALAGGALVGVSALTKETKGFGFAKADTEYDPIQRIYEINTSTGSAQLGGSLEKEGYYSYNYSISIPSQTDPSVNIVTSTHSTTVTSWGECSATIGSNPGEDLITFTSTKNGNGVGEFDLSYALFGGAAFDDAESYVVFHLHTDKDTYQKCYFTYDFVSKFYSLETTGHMTSYVEGYSIAIQRIHLEFLC